MGTPTGEGAVERLVRSRQRVADHGEVFTPRWLVDRMLDLVAVETERIDSRFLEPACGSGNFLVPVLERKLAVVHLRYRRSDFEKRHYALLALMCIYGIELLADNVHECRANLLIPYAEFLRLKDADVWLRAGERVLELNILQGDALKMETLRGKALVFPEWAYLGRGRYQRRDFRYASLTTRSAFDAASGAGHESLVPTGAAHPPMSVEQIAELAA